MGATAEPYFSQLIFGYPQKACCACPEAARLSFVRVTSSARVCAMGHSLTSSVAIRLKVLRKYF
eukprot:m.83167 g.83167  ORF g.83167 m.83167 type:complete len:64 (+) comp50803_c0_seq2:202-393(+)